MSPKNMETVKYFENGLWEFLEMYRVSETRCLSSIKRKGKTIEKI
jgi:hypothetical protein